MPRVWKYHGAVLWRLISTFLLYAPVLFGYAFMLFMLTALCVFISQPRLWARACYGLLEMAPTLFYNAAEEFWDEFKKLFSERFR